MNLGFLATHPIQYYTPLFQALAKRSDLNLHVYYCDQATPAEQSAAGFGVAFNWDVPLLEGYQHTFLQNVAAKRSTSGFRGLDVPEIAERLARRSSAGPAIDALVINGWHFKGAWQAMAACRRNNIPYFLRSDSHLLTARSSAVSALKRLLYPLFIRRAAGCLAAGKMAREYFLHYGAPAERVFVVPHAVDNDRIQSQARLLIPEREALRAQWGIGQGQVAWIFAGKFIEKKRPLDFITAVARLRAEGSDSVGIMIGDGPLRSMCEEHARSLNAPIRFAGFLNQSEIVRGYVAGDALVLPSNGEETWGLVVNEAMLCGLPCFVSDQVGCGPDLIEESITGAVFPFGDPMGCSQILGRYAERGRLAAMGVTACRRAGRFSVQAVSDSLARAVSGAARPM